MATVLKRKVFFRKILERFMSPIDEAIKILIKEKFV